MKVCPEGVLVLESGQAAAVRAARCIGHGLCERVCPVDAIFMDEETPDKWQAYIKLNYDLSAVEYDG